MHTEGGCMLVFLGLAGIHNMHLILGLLNIPGVNILFRWWASLSLYTLLYLNHKLTEPVTYFKPKGKLL